MNTDIDIEIEDLVKSASEELADIPYGQIIVLTNPERGLTPIDCRMMEGISFMARQFDKPRILHSKDVIDPRLWDCFVCRINSEQVLFADRHTLLEMLCVFWGLDISSTRDDVRTPILRNGTFWYQDSERHPIKITVKPIYHKKSLIYGDDCISMGFLQPSYTREKSLGDIRTILQDSYDNGLGISINDLTAIMQDIQNKSQKGTPTYTLDIDVQMRPVIIKGRREEEIKNCNIVLIDNQGGRHNLKLTVYCKALYLTFLTFKEGKTIKEISGDKVFRERFNRIYGQLPYSTDCKTPKTFNLWDNNQYLLFTQKLGEIRKAIMDTTLSNKVRELYGVEGFKGEAFGVAGATDEQRDYVMDTFGLK